VKSKALQIHLVIWGTLLALFLVLVGPALNYEFHDPPGLGNDWKVYLALTFAAIIVDLWGMVRCKGWFRLWMALLLVPSFFSYCNLLEMYRMDQGLWSRMASRGSRPLTREELRVLYLVNILKSAPHWMAASLSVRTDLEGFKECSYKVSGFETLTIRSAFVSFIDEPELTKQEFFERSMKVYALNRFLFKVSGNDQQPAGLWLSPQLPGRTPKGTLQPPPFSALWPWFIDSNGRLYFRYSFIAMYWRSPPDVLAEFDEYASRYPRRVVSP
jgi:hypothetical protein